MYVCMYVCMYLSVDLQFKVSLRRQHAVELFRAVSKYFAVEGGSAPTPTPRKNYPYAYSL